MAEVNSCESCGFLEVKTFDMTKIEVEVIPDVQFSCESESSGENQKCLHDDVVD